MATTQQFHEQVSLTDEQEVLPPPEEKDGAAMDAAESRHLEEQLAQVFGQLEQVTTIAQVETCKTAARTLIRDSAQIHSTKHYYKRFTEALDGSASDLQALRASPRLHSMHKRGQHIWIPLLVSHALTLHNRAEAAYQHILTATINTVAAQVLVPLPSQPRAAQHVHATMLHHVMNYLSQTCDMLDVLVYLPDDTTALLREVTTTAADSVVPLLPITEGIIHQVVQQGLHKPFSILFTDDPLLQRLRSDRRARSGCAEPLRVTYQRVGMLVFVSQQPLFNDHIFYQLMPRLAQLLAQSFNALDIYTQQQQAVHNDRYMVAVSLIQNPSLYELAAMTLKHLADLCTVQVHWGQLWVMKRQQSFVTNQFTLHFAAFDQADNEVELQSIDRPLVPATILQRQFTDDDLWLIAAIGQQLPADEQQLLPYPTHTLLVLPLNLQQPVGETTEVLGMLLIGIDQAVSIPASDHLALQRFGRIVAFALAFVAALAQRQDELPQMMHDMSKVLRPLENQARSLNILLEQARNAPDYAAVQRQLHQARETGIMLFHLAGLAKDLLFWADDYSNGASNIALLADEVDDRLPVTTIVTDLQARMDTFATITTGQHIHWLVRDATLAFRGGRTHANLIAAVLFKFLENAIKYGQRADITVTIEPVYVQVAAMVQFAVTNYGSHIPEVDRGQLFSVHFRGTTTALGQGFGLAQAAQIAHLLHGHVGYTATGTAENTFWLQVPLAHVSAQS